MVRMSQVFLGNLHFGHHGCVLKLSEERAERFARLEVDRSVLYLDDHVVPELSVKRNELQTGLHGSVRSLRIIDECAPHDDSSERLDCLCKHVRSVCMRASVVLRTGLAFGIRLDEETTEIRNERIDFLCLFFPPFGHILVQRVGCLETSDALRRCEIDRKEDLESVWTEDVCQCLDLLQIFRSQYHWVGIHVVEDSAVYSEGCVCPGIFLVYRKDGARQAFPFPKRFSGISSLNGEVRVVPVVEHAVLVCGNFRDCAAFHDLSGLLPAQKIVCSVQYSCLGVCIDCDSVFAECESVSFASEAFVL